MVVEARTVEKDQYSHTALLALGNSVFDAAAEGEVLALESQSDDQPFWLVWVMEKHRALVGNQVWRE